MAAIPSSTSQLISAISKTLMENYDLETVMASALEHTLTAIGHDAGAILILPPQSNVPPVLLAQRGLSSTFITALNQTESPLCLALQRALDSGEIVTIDDKETGLALFIPFSTKFGRRGSLLIHGKAVEPETENFLETVGRILEWTLQASQTYAKVISTLDTISATIETGFDTEEAEAFVVQRIWQILGTETCSLYLVSKDHEGILFKSTHGKDIAWDYQAILDRGNSLVEACLSIKTPIMVNDINAEPRFNARLDAPHSNEEKTLTVLNTLLVPLMAKDRVIGALQVTNKFSGPFNSYDLGLMTLIANSLANMIYNTRLIQELKVINAELETNRWQLLNSRNTLRVLFDSIPTSIYIIDRKYQLIAVNAARAQKLSSQPSELVGQLCFRALMRREAPCPGCRVLESLFGGKNTYRTERRWETADGTTLDEPLEWEISSYPIFDANEEIIQAILLEQNVTEKRRLEATLAQSEKLAAVGQLAAGVAHEINNPLTVIIANTQLLQRQFAAKDNLPDQQEIDEALELILLASTRASQVVRNLLNFARKEQYELSPTDINETIRNTLSLVQHEIIKRSVTLIFEPDENLPQISASPNHLQGVWLNLIMNAMDSLKENEGKIHITTARSGSNIMVKIADNGQGIPEDRITRIFEPFYTTKAPGHGTGLGLSVCHRIVKQHGGHILVDSQVDVGTEFTVVLPINQQRQR